MAEFLGTPVESLPNGRVKKLVASILAKGAKIKDHRAEVTHIRANFGGSDSNPTELGNEIRRASKEITRLCAELSKVAGKEVVYADGNIVKASVKAVTAGLQARNGEELERGCTVWVEEPAIDDDGPSQYAAKIIEIKEDKQKVSVTSSDLGISEPFDLPVSTILSVTSRPKVPVKPRPKKFGKDYKDYTLEEAKELMQKEGFVLEEGKTRNMGRSTLYSYKNPTTGQGVNFSHYNADPKGRPLDKVNLTYKSVTPTKRRTPEQKRRDNFVLYD
jgi:hypothetical protein